MEEKVLTGTAVREFAFPRSNETKWAKANDFSWYRSKETKGGVNPFGSYMMNKKFIFEEEFNNHIMRVQQV